MRNLFLFIAAVIFSIAFYACGDTSQSSSNNYSSDNSSGNNNAVVNVDNSTACSNYLRGKSFYGGSIRLDFLLDGNVGVYNSQTNQLVFTGYLEMGEKYGNASRKLKVRDTYNSSQVVKLMLSEDGKLIDESDFTIYSTN
jgi:hypothetical protein